MRNLCPGVFSGSCSTHLILICNRFSKSLPTASLRLPDRHTLHRQHPLSQSPPRPWRRELRFRTLFLTHAFVCVPDDIPPRPGYYLSRRLYYTSWAERTVAFFLPMLCLVLMHSFPLLLVSSSLFMFMLYCIIFPSSFAFLIFCLHTFTQTIRTRS